MFEIACALRDISSLTAPSSPHSRHAFHLSTSLLFSCNLLDAVVGYPDDEQEIRGVEKAASSDRKLQSPRKAWEGTCDVDVDPSHQRPVLHTCCDTIDASLPAKSLDSGTHTHSMFTPE